MEDESWVVTGRYVCVCVLVNVYTFSRPVNVSRCRLGQVKTEVRRWRGVKEKTEEEKEEEY